MATLLMTYLRTAIFPSVTGVSARPLANNWLWKTVWGGDGGMMVV